MDFKNSCMVESYDRSDFLDANFFCLGHFLIIFSKMMDQKETPAKKDSKMKNYFFHARQPRAEIFYFCAQQNCILIFLYRGAIIYESPCSTVSKTWVQHTFHFFAYLLIIILYMLSYFCQFSSFTAAARVPIC